MRAKLYPIVVRALDEGLRAGYRRAHKHEDHPDEQALLDAQCDAILAALEEVVTWPDDADR